MATLTQGQVYAIALAAGLPNPKVMAAVAMAESSGRTDVVNSIGCVGLWQINQPVHVKTHPTWTVSWLKNPMNNAAAAKVIYQSQGMAAWEAYTGKDGVGSDGPWRQFADSSVKADQSGVTQASTSADNAGFLQDITPDWMETIGQGVVHTADVLVNPRTWLRVAYGVIGAGLVAGGLFLMVRNTAVQQVVGQAAGAIKKGMK